MSPAPRSDFVLEPGDDQREVPVRLLVVQGEETPPVDASAEPMVMAFPHLLVRELVAFLALGLGITIVSLLFDAPLEEIANPEKTPNPAKAPWYFLGLQELLHYYPPLISGVLLPGIVLFALVIVPYFDINLERAPFARGDRGRKLAFLWMAVAAGTVVFAFTGAHAVWPAIGPLWFVALLASIPLLSREPNPRGVLGRRSLPFWVFFWFLLVAATLTVIGVFFRGPGWSFTLPWRDGVY